MLSLFSMMMMMMIQWPAEVEVTASSGRLPSVLLLQFIPKCNARSPPRIFYLCLELMVDPPPPAPVCCYGTNADKENLVEGKKGLLKTSETQLTHLTLQPGLLSFSALGCFLFRFCFLKQKRSARLYSNIVTPHPPFICY